MEYKIEERTLHFKQPAGTSRGVYIIRKIWLIHLYDGNREGLGECAPLPDLSCDAMSDEQYEAKLRHFCEELCCVGEIDVDSLLDYPSMRFGLETARLLSQEGHTVYGTVRREVEPLPGVHYLKVDVRDREAVKSTVQQVIE